MRGAVVIAAAVLAAAACEEKPATDLAGKVAEGYYSLLKEDAWTDFADGYHRPDSIPQGYRRQLAASVKMAEKEQRALHGSIAGVKAVRTVADSTGGYAHVFLLVTREDSTAEEILVPMVERGGLWYMK